MNIGLFMSIILFVICVILIITIYFTNKSIEKIGKDVEEILNNDTNSLVMVSTSNKQIKKIANKLNIELKRLRKAKIQYENGSEELKRTITNISHDMRTPLTAISGYIELMENSNDGEKSEDGENEIIKNKAEDNKKYIEIIKRKTNELIELTEQLFTFSTTMDTLWKMDKENCCINEILEEILAEYYSIFKKENIVPEINICDEKIYRDLNKNSLVRIFENILSNMIKYSDGEFKVNLEISGKITFSNKAEDLDTTTVQKIFDRYFTVENAKSATGVGLSIAKQLVELNDGTIMAKYIDGNLVVEVKF